MKLTAETTIKSDPETVWRFTHDPAQHVRWDIRFTHIEPLPTVGPGAPQRFRYATRIGAGISIEGWGETVGQPDRRGSALRFGSADPRSLIREGSGCWIYRDDPGQVRFSTVYDYAVRYGRLGIVVDRLVFRPLMQAATRWSFDRLRLWMEQGIAPELSLRLWLAKTTARVALGLVWLLEGLVPKLLFPGAAEVDWVRRASLFWPPPDQTLGLLGVAEILAGLWLLSGRAERPAMVVTTLAMLILTGLALVIVPGALADPLGGIIKNLALLACALTVWWLSPVTPSSRRGAPGRRRK